MADLGPHAPPDSREVYLEDPHEVLLLVLVQGDVRPGDAGVVVCRVQPAEDFHRMCHGVGHLPEVGDVRGQRLGPRPQRPGGLRGIREALGVGVDQRDRSTRGGKGDGAGPADAGGRAGDQRDAP